MKAVNGYENIILIGDLSVDVSDSDKNRNSLYNLTNRKTKNLSGITIDIMLTDKPNCFK